MTGTQDFGDKLVIVIDPGHGGENLGTIENNHIEKDMDMTTAMAMYDELLRFDDVEVYMTHTEDVDMSLKERAEFAKKMNADFIFSIHYNASASHELFGSEVWVSSVAPYNAYGYQFGYEFLRDMQTLGLVNRGVKTRLGNNGKDYYGIIREAVSREIPAVIVEHCHVDEMHDIDYCDTEEELKAFGVADATAVAKYFGLKSTELGVDYSDYELTDVNINSQVEITLADKTEPDICMIDVKELDYDGCQLTLEISATDFDSPILYYSYSLDGGDTYSIREYWPESDTLTGFYPDTVTLTLDIPAGTQPEVVFRVYNMYELYLESNVYQATEIFGVSKAAPEQTPEVPTVTMIPVLNEVEVPVFSDEITVISAKELSLFAGVAMLLVLGITIICQAFIRMKRKNRSK